MNRTVVPGDDLGKAGLAPGAELGPGVYAAEDGSMYASLSGTVRVADGVVRVESKGKARSAVPAVGDAVVCRVSRVNPRHAGVDIIAIAVAGPGSKSRLALEKLPLAHKGTIRQQDIYSVEEREEPVVYNCFRPTDLVRAEVLGVGDSSTGFLLSTGTKPELGVIEGRSTAGGELLPAAWNEMVCSITGQAEPRKCAKPL